MRDRTCLFTYRLLNAWSFLSHLFSTIAIGIDKFCLQLGYSCFLKCCIEVCLEKIGLGAKSNGEGPHQWNFNSIIYCLRQNVNKHTHILLCAQQMRRMDLTSPLILILFQILIWLLIITKSSWNSFFIFWLSPFLSSSCTTATSNSTPKFLIITWR